VCIYIHGGLSRAAVDAQSRMIVAVVAVDWRRCLDTHWGTATKAPRWQCNWSCWLAIDYILHKGKVYSPPTTGDFSYHSKDVHQSGEIAVPHTSRPYSIATRRAYCLRTGLFRLSQCLYCILQVLLLCTSMCRCMWEYIQTRRSQGGIKEWGYTLSQKWFKGCV
jgi:hypothetical protein